MRRATAPGAVPVILLLSTSDTDLLSRARPAPPGRQPRPEPRHGPARAARPGRRGRGPRPRRPPLLGGGDRHRLASGKPVVALGGEQAPDAEMMELSTVPAGVAAQAHTYLAQGGPENLAQLHAFLSDTVLLTGEGFAPPVELPTLGDPRTRPCRATAGPTIAVLYYRAQQLAGNTAYVEALCTAIEEAGGQALPVFCASLRRPSPRSCTTLRAADAMVVTVLAAGGTKPASASAGGDDEAWDVAELAALDVPILQGALPHHQPRHVGGQRRRALAARRRDPGRRPRVRRPADHRAVLLQGVRRRRALGLRARSRARGPRRRHRRAPRPAAAHPERGQADRADAQRLPDQARPDRQRRRPRHPGVTRSRCCARHGRGRLLHPDKDGAGSPASPSRTATR